uniref:Uncharacterized protein n=1 Tax=Caenorhabditis japonica TaxID=281687 RepID=A0A8R1EIA3_CAEJA
MAPISNKRKSLKANSSLGNARKLELAKQKIELSRVQSLEKENDDLKLEVENLRNKLADMQRELQLEKNHKEFLRGMLANSRRGCFMLQEDASERNEQLASIRHELQVLKNDQNCRLHAAKKEYEFFVEKNHREKLEKIRKQTEELKKRCLPPSSSQKPYNQLRTRETKKQRFETVKSAIETYVGPENMDSFLTDFIGNIASDPRFSFSTTLDAWDSFVATTHWKLSDGFLKDFKAFWSVAVTRKIVQKPLGDCKFLSAVFNHAGQSSRSPCYVCNASWSNHGAHASTLKSFKFEESGSLRTLEQLQNEGNPLLELSPELAGPPQLHTFLGIVQSYVVNWLIALANREDYGPEVLPLDLKKQCKLLKSAEREEQWYESRARGLRFAIENVQRVLEVITKLFSDVPSRKSAIHQCGSVLCVASFAKKSTFGKLKSFQCTSCKRFIHNVCGFVFTSIDEEQSMIECNTQCVDCREGSALSLQLRKELLEELLDELVSQLEEDADVLNEVKDDREELEGMLRKSSGQTRKQLEETFRQIGCDYRVWYQELTGNQVRKLLRHSSIDLILSVFAPSEELRKMRKVMESLAFLMSEADNRIKSDEDIDKIANTVNLIVFNLRDLQPNVTVTPKLHILAAHLIPFLRKHRSWGRMTEQGLESLHAIINNLTNRFASVRDTRLQYLLILQQLGNYNLLFDTGISMSPNS